jgi:hypothetical protein
MTCFDGRDGDDVRSDRPVRTQSTACGQAVATAEFECGFALNSRLDFDLREIVTYALNRRSCAAHLGPAEPGLYSPPGNLVMSRSWFTVLVVASLVVVLAAARYGLLLIHESEVEAPLLATSGGRVQLVSDEQSVGLVKQGVPLSVTFTIANTGTEALVLRQSRTQHAKHRLPKFTIEPGRTGEVTAEIWSDELLDRGLKHVRFVTSDRISPELWLTVRGTVVRRAAVSDGGDEKSDWEDFP